MKNRKRLVTRLLNIGRILPLAAVAAVVIFCVINRDRLTVESILRYTPQSYPLAAAALVGMYALKSLSVIFPIAVLYLCAGLLFSPFWAIVVNLAGLFVCLTLPFLLGRLYGRGLVEKLAARYPSVRRFDEIKSDNEYFLAYFVKVIGVIPCDVSSLLFGAMRLRYRRYIVGAMVGMLPFMAAATFLGRTITQPGSPGFWISCAALPLISGISYLLYRRYLRRRKRPDKQ